MSKQRPSNLKATKHQTPRKVTPRVDPVLDSYARHLEGDDTTPTRPLHKHKRYMRIGNKPAYDKNFVTALGEKTIEDVKRNAGRRTRLVFK